jgi:hypothetical protein
MAEVRLLPGKAIAHDALSLLERDPMQACVQFGLGEISLEPRHRRTVDIAAYPGLC